MYLCYTGDNTEKNSTFKLKLILVVCKKSLQTSSIQFLDIPISHIIVSSMPVTFSGTSYQSIEGMEQYIVP